jgi:hypothetical protein
VWNSGRRYNEEDKNVDLYEKGKVQLYSGGGKIQNARTRFINKDETPVLYGIVLCYEGILAGCRYSRKMKNSGIRKSSTMKFYISIRNKKRLTLDFFGNDFFVVNKNKIRNLTARDFYLNNERIKTYDEFHLANEIPVTRDNFNKIRNICTMSFPKFSKKSTNEKKCTRLCDFLNRKKKGGCTVKELLAQHDKVR